MANSYMAGLGDHYYYPAPSWGSATSPIPFVDTRHLNWGASSVSELARLEAEHATRGERIKRLKSFGPDNFEVGSVLVFDKTFEDKLRREPKDGYHYAAIKGTETKWYLTGKAHGDPKTWDELVSFMADGVDEVFYVTAMERIV